MWVLHRLSQGHETTHRQGRRALRRKIHTFHRRVQVELTDLAFREVSLADFRDVLGHVVEIQFCITLTRRDGVQIAFVDVLDDVGIDVFRIDGGYRLPVGDKFRLLGRVDSRGLVGQVLEFLQYGFGGGETGFDRPLIEGMR